MKTLSFIRPPGSNAPPMYVGPDDIVRTAEQLGRLEIARDWGSGAYKAQIRFENRNGSTIWAGGIDTDFFTAVAKAVQEAERLK